MGLIRHLFSFFCFFCIFGTSSPLDAWILDWPFIQTIGKNPSSQVDLTVNNNEQAVAVFVHNNQIQSAILHNECWNTLPKFLSSGTAIFPKVSSNEGKIVSVWVEILEDGGNVIQAASFKKKCQNWSNPIDISGSVSLVSGPLVKVDSNGNALIVWSILDNNKYHIQSAILPIRCPKNITYPDDIIADGAFDLDLAMDPNGNAVLVWEGRVLFPPFNKAVIQGATLKSTENVWKQTNDLSPSIAFSTSPKVGVDGQGNAIAVWTQSFFSTSIHSSILKFGSNVWVPPVNNPTEVGNAISPQIAVDLEGNAVAIWQVKGDFGSSALIQASQFSIENSSWGASTDLITVDSAIPPSSPQIVVDDKGDYVSSWITDGILQMRTLPHGKDWSPIVDITTDHIDVSQQSTAISRGGFTVIGFTATIDTKEVVKVFQSKKLFCK